MKDNAVLALNATFAKEGYGDGANRHHITSSTSSDSEVFAQWPTQEGNSPPNKHEEAKKTLAQQNESQLLTERSKVQNLESRISWMEDEIAQLRHQSLIFIDLSNHDRHLSCRECIDYIKTLLIEMAYYGTDQLDDIQVHSKRCNWSDTSASLGTVSEIEKRCPGLWKTYSEEERKVLAKTSKSDAIIHRAGQEIHCLKPSNMTSGHKQQMADNIRAIVNDKTELAAYEALYCKLTGYTSFTAADAALHRQREEAIALSRRKRKEEAAELQRRKDALLRRLERGEFQPIKKGKYE